MLGAVTTERSLQDKKVQLRVLPVFLFTNKHIQFPLLFLFCSDTGANFECWYVRGCFRAFVYHECPTLPSALPPEAVEAVDAAISHTAARLCARLALDD